MIPIRNLYYLLCYAWRYRPEGAPDRVALDPECAPVDLWADILTTGAARLLRRGLQQGYVERSDRVSRLRGRVDVFRSARTLALASAQAWCDFDELSKDIPENQVLRATLRRVTTLQSVDAELRATARDLYRRLAGVQDVALDRAAFRQIQLHANSREYAFLLNVCRLIMTATVPSTQAGDYRFLDVRRDEIRMHALFERFLFNFYGMEQREFAVKRDRFQWEASGPAADLSLLPMMETDVSLRSSDRTVIMDAKYYKSALTTRHEKPTLQSSHLYQLVAYMDAARRRQGDSTPIEGALIYPWVHETLDLAFTISGYPVRVVTIDLSAPTPEIRSQLLGLLRAHPMYF